MMSIKNVVELGHENQETAQTTLENDANKNYTDNRDTSIYEESKENLDHEISAGMGGESRDSSSRTADEGLGTNAGSSQSSEISEGIDNVQWNNVPCTKVIDNGVLYILRDGKIYNILGTLVR